jgi:hypothetical protein
MISDALLRLSGTATAGQAHTIALTTVWYSTNVVDLASSTNVSGGTTTSQNRDIGEGEDLYVVFTIGTLATGAAGAVTTAEVTISTSATDGAGTITVLGTTAIPYTGLVSGQQFVTRINPQMGSVGARYLGVRYTNNATAWVGSPTIFADVVTDISDSKKFYGSGFTVT